MMVMNFGRTSSTRISAVLFLVVLFSGSCIFSPNKGKDEPITGGTWQDPKTPDNVLNNLKVAFETSNIEFYRKCLHDNYFYVSQSETDSLDLRWSKSEDVQIVENVMKGSTKFIFNAAQNSEREEYGKNYPDIPVGATIVDDHPNEMWLVINYTVRMQIYTKSYGDITVDQYMEFKFVQDPTTKMYSIIQWNDLSNLTN
jgi:hypothetical protein